MTGEIRLDVHALESARGGVQAAADELQRERAALGAAARELFASGWRGRAAAECARAFEEWDDGVGVVAGSLSELASGLGVAGGELTGHDAAAGRDLSRLLARLDGTGAGR